MPFTQRISRTAAAYSILLFAMPRSGSAQQIDQAVEGLTVQIVESLQAEEKTTIAVVEFTDLSGQVTPLGRLVGEELVSQLFNHAGERLKLVERSKLEEVLGEQRLGVKGLLEKQNVETFGRVLGVEAILTGTIALLDDRVRINARLIAVPSAELFATAATYMSRLGLSESYFQPEQSGRSEGHSEDRRRPGPVASTVHKGISYDLLACTKETRMITCQLILTNNGVDREYKLDVTWHSKTFLYDQRGHQFFVSRVRLADVDVSDATAVKYLIAEVPTEAKLFFEGVPSSVEFIKILHLSTSDGVVEFRDVQLSGSGNT